MTYRMFGKVSALAAILGLAPAFAQSPTFDVPFTFTAGTQVWRPGHYQVSIEKRGLLTIRNTQTNQSEMMLTNSTDSHAATATQAVLHFNKYGNNYFLSQVWVGQDTGAQLRQSRAERERASALGPVIATVKAGGR